MAALDTDSASKALFGKFLNKSDSPNITPVIDGEMDNKSGDEVLPLKQQVAEQSDDSSNKKSNEAEITDSILTYEDSKENTKSILDIKLEQHSIYKPKWQSLDKVTVLLSTEQKEGLDKIAKKIMKYRSDATKGSQEKERVTANTLMRVLVDAFLERESQLEMEVIIDEEAARKWIEKLFLSNS